MASQLIDLGLLDYYDELIHQAIRLVKVDVDKLTANYADINGVLTANEAHIQSLSANLASFTTLYAKKTEIEELVAEVAKFKEANVDKLKADLVTVTGQLTATVADLEKLNAGTATIFESYLTKATIESEYVKNSQVENLVVEKGFIKKLDADSLYADNAVIEELNGSIAHFNTLLADKASIHDLEIQNGKIETLTANKADINFANVNVGNISEAWIKNLMVQGKVLAQDGTIYKLNAIKVTSENIDVGTLKADRIVMTGPDGVFYNLNINSLGQGVVTALTQEEQEKLQKTIHADVITAHTITTEHITVNNLEGTGGWINLANGTFNYSNAESGEGISWDGEHLIINATDLEINLKDFINNTTSRTTNLELSTENISQELREHKNSTDSRISSITQNYEKIVSDIEKVNETLVGSGNILKELKNLSIVLEPNETNLFTNNGSILRLGLTGTNKFSFYKESNFESVYTDEEIYSLGLSVECELGNEQHKITVKAGDKELTFEINDSNKDLVLNNISFKDNHILEISSEDRFYLLIGKMRLIKGDQYIDKTQGLLSIGTTVEQNDATIKFLTKKLETQKDLLTNQINDLKSLRKFIIINDENDDDASIILATSTKSDGTPNGFYSKWTNKGLYFYQNWGDETPIAFFTNNELQINRSVVVESMRIGNYEWVPLVNNNGDDILVLRYLGGRS